MLTHCDEKLVTQILHEYRIHNADVLFRDDCTVDDLIDAIEGNRRYIRCLYVYNKIDVLSIEEARRAAHSRPRAHAGSESTRVTAPPPIGALSIEEARASARAGVRRASAP